MEKVYNITGSESLYTNSVYKKKFSTENKKSHDFTDLLRYCMYLISYGEAITLRKLKNHFTESTINYAFSKKVLVPYDLSYVKDEKYKEKYKNALFFTYFNYCKKNNIGTWRCRHEAGYKNDIKNWTEEDWKKYAEHVELKEEDDISAYVSEEKKVNSWTPKEWNEYAVSNGYDDGFAAFSDYIDGKRK